MSPMRPFGEPMQWPENEGTVTSVSRSPARLFAPGDKIIILAEVLVEPSELETLDPIVVFVDDKNKVTEVKHHSTVPHPSK